MNIRREMCILHKGFQETAIISFSLQIKYYNNCYGKVNSNLTLNSNCNTCFHFIIYS